MDSNYKVAYNTEWDKLKKLNLFDVSKRLEVEYCKNKKQITIPYFENDYILDFNTQTIYKNEDKTLLPITDCIILLNYLTYSNKYVANTNKWVSLKEIPNGGSLFYPAFYKSSIIDLIKNFGENIENFEKSSLNLGGKYIKFGDKAYEFKVLPKIKICVAIWEGDEEVTPNATILFEPSIQDLVHIETVIGIGMCVAKKLIY